MKKLQKTSLGIVLVLLVAMLGTVAHADIGVQVFNGNTGNNQVNISTQQPGIQTQPQTVYNPQYVAVEEQVKVVPVYQFYSDTMRDHFWTIETKEAVDLQNAYTAGTSTYAYKGVAGYVYEKKVANSTPVYRFWNKKTLDHFYTISKEEKKQVEKDYKNGKDNYEYEGVAWWAPTSTTKPVYRFFDTVNFNHYYTSDASIYEQLTQLYATGQGSYRYEGIAWYWY